MKKGLLVTTKLSPNNYFPERLSQTGMVEWIHYDDLVMQFGDEGLVVAVRSQQLNWQAYSWAMLCGSYSPIQKKGFTHIKLALMRHCIDNGLYVFNQKSLGKYPFLSKLDQHFLFVKNSIPMVESVVMGRVVAARLPFGYPVVVKRVLGSQGKQVHKVRNLEELKSTVKKYGAGRVLMQKMLTVSEDYRLLVLGEEVLGGIKRRAPKGSFLTNFSAGGSVEEIKVGKKMKDLAIRATQAGGLDFCGVDIVRDGRGRYRVFEINRDPGFEGFEKATGLDVATKVVEFGNERGKHD